MIEINDNSAFYIQNITFEGYYRVEGALFAFDGSSGVISSIQLNFTGDNLIINSLINSYDMISLVLNDIIIDGIVINNILIAEFSNITICKLYCYDISTVLQPITMLIDMFNCISLLFNNNFENMTNNIFSIENSIFYSYNLYIKNSSNNLIINAEYSYIYLIYSNIINTYNSVAIYFFNNPNVFIEDSFFYNNFLDFPLLSFINMIDCDNIKVNSSIFEQNHARYSVIYYILFTFT